MGKCIASLAPCTPILFGVHTGQGTRHLLDLCCQKRKYAGGGIEWRGVSSILKPKRGQKEKADDMVSIDF
ncbi:hypothetical protein SLEP1_g36835 [Rubroshorea leprosula]|uniref:Uncharacterized protein n=1 Tax=Rubroshorea leprosula TaxID=152421 RepID=A0AAV5KT85_9ROSI|nr:hypothetical protein SLEP1_g36835 [Rubroshorea leprosula]